MGPRESGPSRAAAFVSAVVLLLVGWSGVSLPRPPWALGTAAVVRAASLDITAAGRFVCEAGVMECALARQAVDAARFPWQAVGYTVTVKAPVDGWHTGLAEKGERRITLYVAIDSTVTDVYRAFVHELGHAVHYSCGPGLLDEWRQRRALGSQVPDHVEAPHAYDSVEEDFAEAFAQWLGAGSSRSSVGAPVTTAWLVDNADLLSPEGCW